METIYLSLREQVAVGTFFMKSPVHWVSFNLNIHLSFKTIVEYLNRPSLAFLTHFYREHLSNAINTHRIKRRRQSYGPVRKPGVGKPPGRNQNRCFISEKEKKMTNVLNWKNMQKYFVTFLQGYPQRVGIR